jgi:hypothetical protein
MLFASECDHGRVYFGWRVEALGFDSKTIVYVVAIIEQPPEIGLFGSVGHDFLSDFLLDEKDASDEVIMLEKLSQYG